MTDERTVKNCGRCSHFEPLTGRQRIGTCDVDGHRNQNVATVSGCCRKFEPQLLSEMGANR